MCDAKQLALHRAAQGAPDAAGAASLRRQQLETYKTLLLHTQQAYAPNSDQVAVCHERLAVREPGDAVPPSTAVTKLVVCGCLFRDV